MKIRSVTVGSYGTMRDRRFELAPGLNVFYGPNEAGKSTLRSFITTAMFPKAPLKYPAQKGSDSGSVDVVLESGNTLTFTRDGRKCSGLGTELCGIDDREYVSIYSLSPDDLRDVKGIEKGDIRNRFLTIPGGADLPRAYESLNAERTALLPEQKRSAKCGIAVLIDKEHDLSVKVRKLQNRESGDSRYAELVSERNLLKAELEKAGIVVRDADAVRSASHKAAGRVDDLRRIAELEVREKEIAYSEGADRSMYAVLTTESERTSHELEKARAEAEGIRTALGGRDPVVFVRNRERILRLAGLVPEYDYYSKRCAESAASRPASKKGLPLVAVAGVAVAAVGVIAAFMVSTVAGAGIAAVGMIVAVIGLRSGRPGSSGERVRSDGIEKRRLGEIEAMLDEVAADTGIERRGFHADVAELRSALERSDMYDAVSRRLSEAEEADRSSSQDLSLFLSGYGGREGFERAVKDSEELTRVRSQLQALRESTKDLELTEIDTGAADAEYNEANDHLRELSSRLAGVEQALRDISEDESVEDAITAWTEADDMVYAACKRWARLQIEKLILDEAAAEAYGNHCPDVLRRADGYLMQMTDGRYRLNTDPRTTEISVIEVETGTVKTVKEWSSGLEDQIKMSVKLAVSLSLSQEKPPVILDDLLLTSDTGRKGRACSAIVSLSEEIQVLYFTCDRETRDLMRSRGANILDV